MKLMPKITVVIFFFFKGRNVNFQPLGKIKNVLESLLGIKTEMQVLGQNRKIPAEKHSF